MKEYIVINKETKTVLSEHDTRQEALAGWQKVYFSLDGIKCDTVLFGKTKNMKKYLKRD